MKSKNLISGLGKVLLIFIGILSLCTLFGWGAAIGVGVAMATGTVVDGGTITEQAARAADVINMTDVQRKVELYKQYQTPLLSLISNNKAPAVKSNKYEFYAIDNRGLYTTCSGAGTISSSDSVIIAVASTELFTRFNTVSFTSITGSASGSAKVSAGNFLAGLITSIGDDDTITVKLLNPGADLASADFTDVKIYRSGSAHNETAASTSAWGKLPEKDYNYVQIFMEQVEQSEYQELMKKEANWGMADLKKMAIEDFKMQRERSFLTGYRTQTQVTIDGTQKDIFTCGGFLNDPDIPIIDNQTLASFEGATFVNWLKRIFTGNNGAKTRYLLGGADLIEAIENVNIDKKWLTAKETEVVNGVDFVKFVSTFGSLSVMYYEQLDLLGMPKKGIVMDKSNIWTGDLKGQGFNVRPLDLKKSGIAKVDAAVIEQSSTMLIKNKATHAIIEGV